MRIPFFRERRAAALLQGVDPLRKINAALIEFCLHCGRQQSSHWQSAIQSAADLGRGQRLRSDRQKNDPRAELFHEQLRPIRILRIASAARNDRDHGQSANTVGTVPIRQVAKHIAAHE